MANKTENKALISVPCKRYIYRYLCNNYSNYLDNAEKENIITLNKGINGAFRYFLSKHNNEKVIISSKQYSKCVKIAVSPHILEKYGYELSNKAVIHFNTFMSEHIYQIVQVYLELRILEGYQFEKSVYAFQEKYGFTEDDFPFETIKKHFQRNSKKLKEIEK